MAANDLIPYQIITLVAVIVSLICIYGTNLPVIGGVLAIIASVLAAVLGTDSLRYVGKYSLGTGVPSIVYMLTALGLISYMAGMMISSFLNQPIIFPVISLIVASVISLIISLICKYIFGIRVEILSKSFILISVSSTLLMISLSALVSQTWNPTVIYENVIQNGIILLLMIISVMIIQNPYNSCMGPNEEQIRTLSFSCSNVFIMLGIVSIISMLTNKYWMLYLLVSVIGWFFFFRKYVLYSKKQAASIRSFGLWPTDDGDD